MFKKVCLKRKSSIFVFFMVALMFSSTIVAAALQSTSKAAPASAGQAVIRDAEDNADYREYMDKTMAFQSKYASIGEEDEVLVLINVDDNSLTKKYINSISGQYASVSEYARSNAGIAAALGMKEKQDSLKRRLNEKFDMRYHFSFTAIANGFSAYIKYKDLESIEKMDGVSSVVLSEKYDQPQMIKSNAVSGGAVINEVDVKDTGIYNTEGFEYQGEGTIVAVLDTGLDYTHPAFNTPLKNPDNVKVTKATIARSIENGLKAAQFTEHLGPDDVFISDKVPYGYDYADMDSEVFPTEDHGTHVAGIVAGKDDVIDGVAPQAQLAIMKVFEDKGGAAEDVGMLAAVEDCVWLDVDVINMSLGMGAGFSREGDRDKTDEIYNMVKDAGINLIVSAGNAASSAFGATYGTNLTSNPDSGTVGSPSSYDASLSIANISGVMTPYLEANNQDVIYFYNSYNSNSEEYDFVQQLLDSKGAEEEAEFEYVVIGGLGERPHYSAVDVRGKIALVKRGVSTFEDKIKTATDKGAVGVIIYNHLAGVIRMSIGDDRGLMAPNCSIKMDEGAKLLEAAEKNRQAGKGYGGTIKISKKNAAGPFMVDSSSWGPIGDLELKPEITGHGGEIYSAIIGGGYDRFSGTSMSAPNVAGLATLTRQHLNEHLADYVTDADQLTVKERNKIIRDLTNQLLMSTATIALTEKGVPYSPRRQGAGLATVKDAVVSKAFIYIEGSDKTKISAKDDPAKTGKYDLTFNVKNISTQELTYRLKTYTMTETLSSDLKTVAEEPYMLDNGTSVSVTKKGSGAGSFANNNFVLPAKSDTQFTVSITLNAEQKAYIDKTFENGMFVEGFISLEPLAMGEKSVHVPWLAFYGDWTAAPLLDANIYDVTRDELDDGLKEHEKTKAAVSPLQPYGVAFYDNNPNDEWTMPMGRNVWNVADGYRGLPADNDKNALSLDTSSLHKLYYMTGFLRNAKNVNIRVTNNTTGQIMWDYDYTNARKTIGILLKNNELNMTTFVSETGLKFLEGNQYNFALRGELDYEGGEKVTNNEYSFDFYIDSTPPSIEDASLTMEQDRNRENKKYYMNFQIYDNHYPSAINVQIYDKNTNQYESIFWNSEFSTPALAPITATKGSVTTVPINVTPYWDRIKENNYEVLVTVYDHALNCTEKYVDFSDYKNTIRSVEFSTKQLPKTLSIHEEYDLMQVLTVTGNREGAPWEEDFIWTSQDETIAKVFDGKVTGYKTGSTVIEVTSKADPSKTDSIRVNIGENVARTDVKPNKLTLNVSGISLGVAAQYELEAKVLPYSTTEEFRVRWMSTNESVATVAVDPTNSLKAIVTAHKEKSQADIRAVVQLKNKVTGEYEDILVSALCVVVVPEEFVVGQKTLNKYNGGAKVLNIPADRGIEHIGRSVFRENETIEKVIIPEGVKTIMYGAFAYCKNLKEVVLPASLLKIEDWAFAVKPTANNILLHSLEKVTINKINGKYNLRTIGNCAFYMNAWLKEIDLSQVATIGDLAFYQARTLTSLDLSNLRYCGTQSFMFCSGLTNIKFSKFAVIGTLAFACDYGLTSLELPMQRIGAGAFLQCFSGNTGLTSVKFTNKEPLIIGAEAFVDNPMLRTIDFQGPVSVIGNTAFANTGVTSIKLPSGLKVMGGDVFAACPNLTRVIISEGTELELIQGMIWNSTNISTIAVESANPHFTAENGILYNKEKTEIVMVAPKAVLGTNGVFTVPSTVTKIWNYAFSQNLSLKQIIMPSVKEIGNGAFALCNNLETIELPGTLESIGSAVFDSCAKLRNVTFGSGFSLTSLGDYAFAGAGIINITLPASVTAIPEAMFLDCAQLVSVTATAPLTKIGVSAFEGCKSLQTLDTSAVTEIGAAAFMDCTVINNLDLSKAVTIGNYAFGRCSALQVTELAAAEEIGMFAFAQCNAITSISLPQARIIGDYAFTAFYIDLDAENPILEEGDSNIVSVSLPKAERIGLGAFQRSKLTEVTLPKTLQFIDAFAFGDSAGLLKYIMPEAGTYFVQDEVLYKNVPNGYELIAYPCAKADDTYKVLDGTVRIDTGAFMNNQAVRTYQDGDEAVTRAGSLKAVYMPYELELIGNYAFFGSSDTVFYFTSLYAPTLETDVIKTEFRNVAGSFRQYLLTINNTSTLHDDPNYHTTHFSLGNYNNFVENFTKYHDEGVTSTIKMVYPVNGVNYDSMMYSTYFGVTETGEEVMGDFAKQANAMFAALPAVADYKYQTHGDQVLAAWLAYNEVASSQVKFLENTQKLLDLQVKYLIDYIDSLPDKKDYDPQKDFEDKDRISQGRRLYNTLSADNKAKITNYETLDYLYNMKEKLPDENGGGDGEKEDPACGCGTIVPGSNATGFFLGGGLLLLVAGAGVFFLLRKKKAVNK